MLLCSQKRTGNQERLTESKHSRSRKNLSDYVAHLFDFIDEFQELYVSSFSY